MVSSIWIKESGKSTLFERELRLIQCSWGCSRSFAYVDVAFASVLRSQNPLQRHLHAYDIGCKYGIHFKERVTRSLLGEEEEAEAAARGSLPRDVLIAPADFPTDFSIKVPSWHVLGHVSSCILTHNLRYTPLAGRTVGEGSETVWSVTNQHRFSTREMTHGHRRDALTDVFNDYNWKKLCGESEYEPYGIQVGWKRKMTPSLCKCP